VDTPQNLEGTYAITAVTTPHIITLVALTAVSEWLLPLPWLQ
jgi:hypothetical protein